MFESESQYRALPGCSLKYQESQYRASPCYTLYKELEPLVDYLLFKHLQKAPQFYNTDWNKELLFFIKRFHEELPHFVGQIWDEPVRDGSSKRTARLIDIMDFYQEHRANKFDKWHTNGRAERFRVKYGYDKDYQKIEENK